MKPPQPICFLAFAVALAAPALAQTPGAPTTDKEKLSYALGMDVGGAIKKQGFDLDQNMFLSAVHDGLAGTPPKMTEDESHKILMDFSKQLQAKRQAKAMDAQAAGPKNKADGAAFLAANKTKPGVVTLPDGLQYKVIAEGTGASPGATDTVTVKYKGTFIDGTEFDSSDKNGGPISFPVNGVIKGWTEALQKMKVGSKWQLFIPSDLAYGDRGKDEIQPGTTLLFDVELTAIAK